ncbi:Tyrocidine synthase III [Legionella massiliensis]|uniref:Tyrocidine synthase III n=1 Tax=Legionella massiliensis TaxID=1034943 RepID=A0A078KVU7_9GAMM|nr:AMP-binding protein [Legionella massiliensis]CDZ77132.1 Tyrocidine synthase III [Legionella massiliensis]CEE12870.1 Tyrocidine synthase 3 [Legionella massiliensis]
MEVKNKLAASLRDSLFKTEASFSLSDDLSSLSSEECTNKIRQYIEWINQANIHSVMIVSSPSIDALCLCYALVLSNKTYIPIHPSTSAELIENYLQNYQIDLLLIQSQLTTQMNREFFSKLTQDETSSFYYYFVDREQASFCLLPGILFFTSGTTEQPKVVHYHYETLSRYLSWGLAEFKLTKEDSFLFTTELTFVASLRPLFIPALAGARLIFPSSGSTNKLQLIINALIKHRITILNLTPTLFKILLRNCEKIDLNILRSIRLVLLSGETLDIASINDWFSRISSDTVFYNLYGATEYLVPFYKKIKAALQEQDRLHLGQLRLGCNYKLIPHSDSYELYVAGDLSTGYFDSNLTKNNFQDIDDLRYIKTNDLLKVDNNELYFCSRAGRLIKKFGQLINLDQIEYLLKKYHGNIDFVSFYDEGSNRVCLIIRIAVNDEILLKKIKNTLNKYLPNYMHPDEFVFTEEVPITASGKLDYRLIKISRQVQNLTDYFQRFFPDNKVDPTKRVIDLGLESIDYIEMSEAFLKITGKWLDVSRINERTQIANIDSCLIDFNFIPPKFNDAVAVSPVQEAAYSQELLDLISVQKYLIVSFALKENIDLDRLEKAISETLENHFILSSKLEWIEECFFFVAAVKQTEFRLKAPIFFPGRLQKKLRTTVNSERLVRIYIQTKKNRYFLTMAYHHIAMDGWSAMLVREEIFRRYEGKEKVKTLSREEEINYLNLVNKFWLRNSYNLDDIESMMNEINPYEFNRLDSIFSSPISKKHSSFCFQKGIIDKLVSDYDLSGFPYSVIFAWMLHRIIEQESGQQKILINTSFSNRNLPVPEAKELITNLAIGFPVFLDGSNLSSRDFALEIQKRLTAYFKNMSYGSLRQIWKNGIIGRKFINPRMQPYTIVYTYINKIYDDDYVQNKYIDWHSSINKVNTHRKGLIYLRVYNMGSQFVVYFDSNLKANCHENMMRNWSDFTK